MELSRRRRFGLGLAATGATLACVLCSDTWSQSGGGVSIDSGAEWRFVRLAYSSAGARSGSRGTWLTDWPDAEQHLIKGVQRLTRINTAEEGQSLSIMDESLYDYPWIYAVEVGSWMLSDEEAERLRDYLLRGGFLVVDDFHGSMEWAGFVQSQLDEEIRKAPDRAQGRERRPGAPRHGVGSYHRNPVVLQC